MFVVPKDGEPVALCDQREIAYVEHARQVKVATADPKAEQVAGQKYGAWLREAMHLRPGRPHVKIRRKAILVCQSARWHVCDALSNEEPVWPAKQALWPRRIRS